MGVQFACSGLQVCAFCRPSGCLSITLHSVKTVAEFCAEGRGMMGKTEKDGLAFSRVQTGWGVPLRYPLYLLMGQTGK